MNYHELHGENEALRRRLFRLSQASLRITEDLEPNAVLRDAALSSRTSAISSSHAWNVAPAEANNLTETTNTCSVR